MSKQDRHAGAEARIAGSVVTEQARQDNVTNLDASYWSGVARSVAPSQPDSLWRRYSDRANVALLERWLAGAALRRILKTDLFDESWTGGYVGNLQRHAQEPVVGIDISPVVAAAARTHHPGSPFASGDVRALPFADGSFDAIVCPSTLDHFAEASEIYRALAELYRVLAPGGCLLITLDNPLHPLVALRNRHGKTALRLGLATFFIGATLGPRGLNAGLRAAGFEVLRQGATQHFPRIVLAAWQRAFGAGGPSSRALLRLALACERLEGLPTRYATGQFVAALAVRPKSPAGTGAASREVDASLTPRHPAP